MIILVFTVTFGLCLAGTAQIGGLTENEILISKDSPELAPATIFRESLITEQEKDYIDMHFVFGVNSLDASHPDPSEKAWDPNYLGQLLWDPDFDVSRARSQEYLFNLCHYFFNFHLTSFEKVSCWIYPFRKYVKQRGLAFPIEERSQYHRVLKEWSATDEGQVYFHERKEVYIVNDEIKFFKIVAKSQLTYQEATSVER